MGNQRVALEIKYAGETVSGEDGLIDVEVHYDLYEEDEVVGMFEEKQDAIEHVLEEYADVDYVMYEEGYKVVNTDGEREIVGGFKYRSMEASAHISWGLWEMTNEEFEELEMLDMGGYDCSACRGGGCVHCEPQRFI